VTRALRFGPPGTLVTALSVSVGGEQLAVATAGGSLLLLSLGDLAAQEAEEAPVDDKGLAGGPAACESRPAAAAAAAAAASTPEGCAAADGCRGGNAEPPAVAAAAAPSRKRSSTSDDGGSGGGAGVFQGSPETEVGTTGGGATAVARARLETLARLLQRTAAAPTRETATNFVLNVPNLSPNSTPPPPASLPGSPHTHQDRDSANGPRSPWRLWLGAPCLPGRVCGLAAAAAVPLVMAVSSEDRAVRVWDWARRRCLVARRLWDEPLCCALHPGGHAALVGTGERLLVLHVLRVRPRAKGGQGSRVEGKAGSGTSCCAARCTRGGEGG
jgi:hypothetical protein